MTLEEYFPQDTQHARRQAEIAGLTQKMAEAGAAHSDNETFVKLMNEQAELCRKRAVLIEELLR